MFDKIIAEIEAEIARLTTARDLLSGRTVRSTATPLPGQTGKRRGRPPMAEDERERRRLAQQERWAKVRAGKEQTAGLPTQEQPAQTPQPEGASPTVVTAPSDAPHAVTEPSVKAKRGRPRKH